MDLAHHWISELAEIATPLLFGINVAANTLPMPGWPIPIAAGFVLGFFGGLALIFVSQLIGATAAFMLARTVLRKRVEKTIDRHRKLKALDRAMRAEGWKAVALLQMTPLIPFGLQNYFLGVSRVTLASFVAGEALGSLPSMLFYVGIGSTGRLIAADQSPWKWAVLGLGVVATFAFTWLIGRVAARSLER